MITEEQRKLRFQGIGGSDVAAIVGLSPWMTRQQLWEEKVRGYDASDAEEGVGDRHSAVWRGRVLEGLVYDKLFRDGTKVIPAPRTYRHAEYPQLIAHLDGVVEAREETPAYLVEIKTTTHGDGWGEPGTDQVPGHVLTQVTHAMTVTGLRSAMVAVLRGTRDSLFTLARMTEKVGSGPVMDAMEEDLDLSLYRVNYNPRLGEFLLKACAHFWAFHVRPHVPPLMNDIQSTREEALEMMNAEVMVNDDILEDIRVIRSARKEIKRLDQMVDESELRVRAFMKNKTTLVTPGLQPLARLSVSHRKTLDQKRARLALGDSWDSLCSQTRIQRLTLEGDRHGNA